MPTPSLDIRISGNLLALYGAVVATTTGVIQIANFIRDRARVKVSVQHDMEMVGDPRYEGITFTILTAVNIGRRPVTIKSMGAYYLHPAKAFVVGDTRPVLPCELTEGKQVMALVDQSDLDLTKIEEWQAWDTAGRTFALPVAPWYKRWKSRRARRKTAKEKAKA